VVYVIDGCRFLQVHRHNPRPLPFLPLGLPLEVPLLAEFLAADLAPASGCSAEIDDAMCVLEDVEDVIDLEKFVGGAGAVALLLSLAIVDILN
jgi:hypothetical protein